MVKLPLCGENPSHRKIWQIREPENRRQGCRRRERLSGLRTLQVWSGIKIINLKIIM